VTAKNETKSEGEIAEIVALLLERGVDCNSLCSDGETPLYRACNKQLDSVVKVLVGAKCEVNQATAAKNIQF
jgi:ankyrin repeat protein